MKTVSYSDVHGIVLVSSQESNFKNSKFATVIVKFIC